jgi:cytochrome c biogenesis protein CcdA
MFKQRKKIAIHCSGAEPSLLAMILGFAALFGALFVITGTLGAIVPEVPEHYSDWLMMTMLGASGWCTCYIFRWFLAEAELIELQRKEIYFRSSRTIGDTVSALICSLWAMYMESELSKLVCTKKSLSANRMLQLLWRS